MLAKLRHRHANEVGVFPELVELAGESRLIPGITAMVEEEMEESRTCL